MFEIVPSGGRPGSPAVTFSHVEPSSRVTWTCPSLVPAQITPRYRGDSAMAKRTAAYVGLE